MTKYTISCAIDVVQVIKGQYSAYVHLVNILLGSNIIHVPYLFENHKFGNFPGTINES